MVKTNELAVLDRLEISYDLAGYPEVKNYEVVYGTLEAMLEGADKLVITADETSVESAKSIKSQLTKYQKRIDEVFEAEEAKYNELVSKKRSLKRLFERSKNYLNDGIEYAKTEWVKEAINEYSRLASEDIDISMIDPKTYSRKLTKKSVFEVIESEVIRIEEEYKKSQHEQEVFEKYCISKGISSELLLDWQKTMSLSEVMERVDYLVEIQAKEAKKMEEVQAPQPVVKVAEPEEIDELEEIDETDETADIWAVMLRMTDKQKSLFKQFLNDTGIELVGKPSIVDDIF